MWCVDKQQYLIIFIIVCQVRETTGCQPTIQRWGARLTILRGWSVRWRDKTERSHHQLTREDPPTVWVTGRFRATSGDKSLYTLLYHDWCFRRRYTDSRHPTTELPDVRDGVSDLPSVRDPPIRNKSKSKEVLEDVNNDEELKRSPNIADRPSYKRWQQTQS